MKTCGSFTYNHWLTADYLCSRTVPVDSCTLGAQPAGPYSTVYRLIQPEVGTSFLSGDLTFWERSARNSSIDVAPKARHSWVNESNINFSSTNENEFREKCFVALIHWLHALWVRKTGSLALPVSTRIQPYFNFNHEVSLRYSISSNSVLSYFIKLCLK